MALNRVLVTGATSLIGISVIDECIRNNIEVVAVIRPDSVKKDKVPRNPLITLLECDINNLENLMNHELPPIDVFYHFAWEATDKFGRNNVASQLRNVNSALTAISVANLMHCGKFIGSGSQAEYGRVDGVISEVHPVSPDTAYGIAKYTAGKLGELLASQLGLPFVWTRIFSVYGVHDMPSTMIMYCIGELLKGHKPSLTLCEQKWDYLNCKDAGKAFYMLGESNHVSGIYNIGSGIARSLREYVEELRDAISPALPLGIGEKEYAPLQIMHLEADISKLHKDTGFSSSIPFNQGIKETIAWYAKEYSK